jgi:hypothetical protein
VSLLPLYILGVLICRQVKFVSDEDYAPTMPGRLALLVEGKIVFHTCYHQVEVPATYLVRIMRAPHANGDTNSVSNAVHHWFLTEVLNAIGNHTIL